MSQYWFKPKTHGYGATPSNWKGWVATLLFALAIGMFVALLMTSSGGNPPIETLLLWCAGVCILSIAFVALARAKTDGQWRWRWGK